MGLGFFGKLPARGDFVTVALSAEVVTRWEATLAAMTSISQDHLGAAWADLWDRAPAWGFWIGAGVPSGPCAGVLRPSRDKVGRRYPMLLLADGSEGLPAPPVVADPDSAAWFETLTEATEALLTDPQADPAQAVDALPTPPRTIAAPQDRRMAFFAEGRQGLASLLSDTSPHDHGLAAARRSYWWAQGQGGSAVLMALDGLPDPSMAASLLQSCSQAPPPAAERPPELPQTEPEAAPTTPSPDPEDSADPGDHESPFGPAP